MPFYEFLWTPDNLEHATDHGVSVEEIERVIKYPQRTGTSRSSGRPMAFGFSDDDREIACVYEMIYWCFQSPLITRTNP